MSQIIHESPLITVKRLEGKPFLKGPIPLAWLQDAATLPGKALHVGISLWFLSGVTRSRSVQFNQNRQERYGVKRDAARRGLLALERAGLVSVARSRGRCQNVVINDSQKAQLSAVQRGPVASPSVESKSAGGAS